MEGCFINSYSTLSKIYDISRKEENIDVWTEFINKILKSCNLSLGDSVLDCGCGTGDISIFLAKSGYVVDAFDISSDMLMVAKEKSHNLGLHINYTIQDMRHFKSHKKYSAITCINDGLNYLTTLKDVEMFFNNCNQYLKDNAFLFFDISSIYKLENMNEQLYAEESDEFSYIWFNEYNEHEKLLTMDLTFFTQIKDNLFSRSYETHVQRGHSIEEIEFLLSKCGFSLISTYSDISLNMPSDKSERIHFLAQKV